MMLGLQDVVEQQQDGYSSLTVGQLKDLLRERGLKVSGVKSDLVARLAEASETNPSSISGTSANISLGGNLGPPGKALHGDVDVGDVDGIARLMMRAGVSVPESYISGRARKAQGSPNEQQKAVQSNLSRNNPGVTADSADSKLFSEGGGSSRGIPSRGGRAGKSRSRADSNKRDPWREKVWHERGSDVPPLKVPGLVMVEGRFDARAVERAVMAQAVFPLQEMVRTRMRNHLRTSPARFVRRLPLLIAPSACHRHQLC